MDTDFFQETGVKGMIVRGIELAFKRHKGKGMNGRGMNKQFQN